MNGAKLGDGRAAGVGRLYNEMFRPRSLMDALNEWRAALTVDEHPVPVDRTVGKRSAHARYLVSRPRTGATWKFCAAYRRAPMPRAAGAKGVFDVFPLIQDWGNHSARPPSLFEARWPRSHAGGEPHLFPAFGTTSLTNRRASDHWVSIRWRTEKFGPGRAAGAEIGLRVNPGCSTRIMP
jgi:hypothetical protein